jgi:hypothetical protein
MATANRKRYARARARGKARLKHPSAVVGARYHAGADLVELLFSGGGSMSIPRSVFPGLKRASASKLEAVVVSAAGDALSWPSLDVDVYVPGIIQRVFGARLFATSTGHRGGRRQSKAKRAASEITSPRKT